MLERFEKFSCAVSEISRYWHKIASEELGKYGLKSSHASYLTTVYRFDGDITSPKICELCGRDKSDVSRMMSILEKNGLVKKESVHQNQYAGYWKLTNEGRKVAEIINQKATLAVEKAGAGLTEENRKIFYQSLEIITNNLRQISEEGL